jgi:hypothetical protein
MPMDALGGDKTIWLYREQLTRAGALDDAFDRLRCPAA